MNQFVAKPFYYICKSNLQKVWILDSIRSKSDVRVRFAPSPTGFVHLGGLRTALYNYLFAKSHKNGKFIVRIEDTDQTRIVPGATEHLLSVLQWTGIVPDESPLHGGGYGPYVQSQRLSHYAKSSTTDLEKNRSHSSMLLIQSILKSTSLDSRFLDYRHANDLIENGSAYRCFCSPRRLMLLKKEQRQRKEITRYDNRCRYLSKENIEENLAFSKPYAIRLKIEDSSLATNDMLFGEVKINSSSIGDMVLLKSDGYPTYHLANVVDDHLMEISHVIRGREWLISTPSHVLLYDKFGWKPPKFMHLPLLINSDGTKLSKRQNDADVEYFKNCGFSPSSLVNFMVYCGSGFKRVKFPILTLSHHHLLRHLAASFEPQSLLQSDAIVDIKKLEDFSSTLTRHLVDTGSEIKMQELIHDLFDKALKKYGNQCIFIQDNLCADDIRSYISRIVKLRKTHIVKPDDLVSDFYDFLWMRPTISDNDNVQFKDVSLEISEFIRNLDFDFFDGASAMSHMKKIAGSSQVKISDLMKFVRLCLTGKEQGPTLFDIILMLGKEESLLRSQALDERLDSS